MDGESFEREAEWKGQFWNCWGLGKWRMIEVVEGKVKVHQNHQNCLYFSATSLLQDKCCKGQKSIPRPLMSATLGSGAAPACFFPTLHKLPQLGKLLTQGNSRNKGLYMWQQVRRTELGSAEEATALHLQASSSQPISFKNTSTPPTSWPGTEPYVCSL